MRDHRPIAEGLSDLRVVRFGKYRVNMTERTITWLAVVLLPTAGWLAYLAGQAIAALMYSR